MEEVNSFESMPFPFGSKGNSCRNTLDSNVQPLMIVESSDGKMTRKCGAPTSTCKITCVVGFENKPLFASVG